MLFVTTRNQAMAPDAKQPRLGSNGSQVSKQIGAKAPSGPMFRSLVGSVKKGLEPQAFRVFRRFGFYGTGFRACCSSLGLVAPTSFPARAWEASHE